jgi:carbamoyl-phosphate synthase large subunit
MSNILVCSAGRRVALVEAFKKEAKKLIGKDSKVFTTDLNPIQSSACQVADKGFKVGKFADTDYIPSLLDICTQNDVKIIIPTIDTELQLLANHQEQFQVIGTQVVISDSDFIKTCRDKRLTNDFFEVNNFFVPKAIDPQKPAFPLFIKPISGSMSKDIFLITHAEMFTESLQKRSDLMFMEYIPKNEYDEYTLDLYYDKVGELKCVVPRLRMEIRSGEISKGLILNNYLVGFVKSHLATIKGARGCLTLQVFKGKTHDKVYGIEINPRFGGGYPMSYLAGANYPNWIIREYLLKESIEWFDKWEANILFLRYDKEVVVHGYNV